MNNPNLEEGRNPRAVTTGKRKILRTIRLFFLQGWAWYRGNYIGSIGRLAAFFAWPDISSIQQQLTSKRTWWFERDRHFHLRRQDGAIHLQKPPSQFKTAKPPTCSKVQSLKLLTYNCQSLGRGSSRLQELVEDMSNVNVTVAALQGTRWQSDNPRSEWVVKGRFGKPLFFAFSWGRPNNNTMLGVQLLISCSLMQHAHVHTRFDPPKGLAGRLGGVRVLSRTPGCELGELFVVAYAPQEGDAVSHAVFFQALLEIVHGVPKRTRVWLLGDFNAHVGSDMNSVSVGLHRRDVVTINNGAALVHACEASGLALANTFSRCGSTWWSPDGKTSHCLDFIAIPQEFRSRVRSCHVNQILGRRWQMSPVRDHWPVEVVAMLPAPWVLLHRQTHTVRWNKHALQVALDDMSVGNAFLIDCETALGHEPALDHDNLSRDTLEAHWVRVQARLHEVACHHFAMRPSQKEAKLLPATFDLLMQKRVAQQNWLGHVSTWHDKSLRSPLTWFFHAFRLFVLHSKLVVASKSAVKADEHAWFARLETRLQRAVDLHDSREAWSVCRQLAGYGPGKVYDKNVPAAKSISRRQWLDHFHRVWGAWSHDDAVVHSPSMLAEGERLPPVLGGEAGRLALLKAAKSLARFRATPTGAIPAELWQLLLQKRYVDPWHVSTIPDRCMFAFEAMQSLSCNPQVWCDGQGCPLPKPGGVPGPNGQRVINLLDPAGKFFFKALLEHVPDEPADHQYGYAPCRSRRDAILQVEAWLDRLRFNKFSTATTLFDLTKAFDTLSFQSIVEVVRRERMPRVVCELLLDLHARLRISLDHVEGQKLQVKLESGVLQGGGTGPRLFRMVYDACIGKWKEETGEHDFAVEYEGHSHTLSIAAYADDLIRIVAGRDLTLLATRTEGCTESLQRLLATRGLKLNSKKGETLLSMKGQGAYEYARRAFSGEWSGYPLKLVVKYLGAHLQSNGSLSAEVRKRVSAAKAGFARFSRFFRRSHVPLSRKFLVFQAVVDSALLSALEIRPLGVRDLQALESARGLLLRRLFGKNGYGAVKGIPTHRSVTVESLRVRVGLATVASELRVRRLLWLRSALLAEQQGQTRLELAALFGVCEELKAAVDPVSGCPTQFAPRFLHLIHSDLVILLPGFVFFADWKARFLAVGVQQIKLLRTCTLDLPTPSPAEPDEAEEEAIPEVLATFQCEQCGAGPWQNARALRAHRVKKHSYRNSVQSRSCPDCNRQFTSKTAAQRHVQKRSCGKAVANHGHAGALAGLRIAENSAAAVPAQSRSAPSTVQTSLFDFFQHAGDGLSSGSREPCRLQTAQAQSRGRGAPQQQVARTASAGSLQTAAESLPSSRVTRQQSPGDGSLVYPHMAAGSSERPCEGTHGTDGGMEGEASTRSGPPSGPLSLDGGRHSRQMGARRPRSES